MEIERKILGINKRELISRISKLHPRPRKIFDGLVRVKYFDFPDGTICKKKDLLRLREISPKKGKKFIELVYKKYKGVKNGCKYFEEFEITISCPGAFGKYEKFLRQLGFKQAVYYEKRRTLFAYNPRGKGKIKFEIDEHPKIPPFLEIEADSASQINSAIKLLGLNQNEQTAETISELLRRKYPRLSLNKLRF